MMTENRPLRPERVDKSQANLGIGGNTTIAPQVVFSLVRAAALSTYGVVGIASRYTGQDSTQRDPHRGLEVTLLPPGPVTGACKRVKVDIHIIVEYGVRILAVTNSLHHQIQYSVEHSTGFCVEEIHIHVDAMRVTEDPPHVS
jgi:uncharacterized alkaline shock family protein YloU